MGRLYKGKCSFCHETFAARSQARLLSKMSKHRWKKHENTMVRKIKAGIKESEENPNVQDFMTALLDSPRAALRIYAAFTERQYQAIKKVMDALEPVLPPNLLVSWKAVEAMHDYLEETRR